MRVCIRVAQVKPKNGQNFEEIGYFLKIHSSGVTVPKNLKFLAKVLRSISILQKN